MEEMPGAEFQDWELLQIDDDDDFEAVESSDQPPLSSGHGRHASASKPPSDGEIEVTDLPDAAAHDLAGSESGASGEDRAAAAVEELMLPCDSAAIAGIGSDDVSLGDAKDAAFEDLAVGCDLGCGGGGTLDAGNRSDSMGVASDGSGGSEDLVPREGEEKKRNAWQEVPMQLLRLCDFRERPILSISVAVAILGFVVLGRRLYKAKSRGRGIPLIPVETSLDDKKASSLVSAHAAARLNEAFSMVRIAPSVRPAALIRAGSIAPWPAVSSR